MIGEITCEFDRAYSDEANAEYIISFKVRRDQTYAAKKAVAAMRRKPYPLMLEINEYKKRRSINANSYFWTLLDKLSEMLQNTKEELYRQFIRDYGLWADVPLRKLPKNTCKVDDPVATIMTGWKRQGVGWLAEIVSETAEEATVRFYYGSSVYNGRQMKRLIDAVVDECKEMGIETRTPEEIASMLEAWSAVHDK